MALDSKHAALRFDETGRRLRGEQALRIVMYADRPASFGGIETHMATLAKELALLGQQVTLAFPRILEDGLFADAKAHGVRVVKAGPQEVQELAASGKVDVLHAHSARASRLAHALQRRYPLLTATTLHGPGQLLPPWRHGRTAIIAVSGEISESLSQQGIPHITIENGVDLKRFHPRAPGLRRPRPLRIVYLGRVSPSKMPGLLALDQAAAFRQEVDVRYVADWAPRAQEAPSPAVEHELSEADLVFATGRGIREAMACGAAVAVLGVFWDGLVTPDTVSRLEWCNFSGRASREPPTARRISLLLRELLADPKRLEQLKTFGASYARRHWDARVMAEKTLEVYQRLKREAS